MNYEEQNPPDHKEIDHSPKKPYLSFIGLILALILPPLGLVVCIIALRSAKSDHSKGVGMASFGIGWGIFFTIPFLFVIYTFISLGGLKSNQAKKDAHPLISSIEKAGGVKICDGGYNGYGIDEEGPEYTEYFRVPYSSQLASKLKTYAKQIGYNLENNKTSIPSGLKSGPGTQYFFNLNGIEDSLSIAIYRNMTVPLYCGNHFYATKKINTGNETIVYISLELRDANQD